MTKNKQNIYFTVGPSQLFPTVEEHLYEAIEQQIGSISHRSKQFEDIFSSAVTNLKALLSIPENYSVFFVSSGTEAMERTIENVVEKYSLHFVNGAFSQRFFETAVELGKKPEKIEVEPGKGFEISVILERSDRTLSMEKRSYRGLQPLQDDKAFISKSTELICFTHNETSTGVILPGKDIAELKKAYPDKLVAIDMVSSAPYGQIDFALTDIAFFSVQKLFGLPAGLGVMIVSPQAIEKTTYLQQKGINIGTYHNFLNLKNFALQNQTTETPSVLHLFLFERILSDICAIGIETIRNRINDHARLLYDFFDTHSQWSPFVKEKTFRSPTVIVANVGKDQKRILELLKKAEMIVGKGYGPHKDTQIRIANFPALSEKDIKKLIDALQSI